jgi:DNA-binding IclR family transcriptional regulator
VPIIAGSAAHLECTQVAAYPGGDHVVYLGRVEKIHRAGRRPLAFGEGRYLVTFAHDLGGTLSPDDTGSGLAQVEAVRLASAALPEICESIGQRTVGLAAWGSHGATIVRWEPSRQPVSPHLRTGVVVSLTQSATGLAFAAFAPQAVTQEAIDSECAARGISPDDLAPRLAEARRHGLARAVGGAPSELHQITVNAFSAPVFNARGEMVLALSTTCRADQLDADWDGAVPQTLRQAADALSRRLGFAGV